MNYDSAVCQSDADGCDRPLKMWTTANCSSNRPTFFFRSSDSLAAAVAAEAKFRRCIVVYMHVTSAALVNATVDRLPGH